MEAAMGDDEVELLTRAMLGFFAPDRGPSFVITSESMAILVDRLAMQLRDTDDRRAVLVHWARHATAARLTAVDLAARSNPPARLPQGLAVLLAERDAEKLAADPTPNFPDI
jgi:hypothetical protein